MFSWYVHSSACSTYGIFGQFDWDFPLLFGVWQSGIDRNSRNPEAESCDQSSGEWTASTKHMVRHILCVSTVYHPVG